MTITVLILSDDYYFSPPRETETGAAAWRPLKSNPLGIALAKEVNTPINPDSRTERFYAHTTGRNFQHFSIQMHLR